MDQLGKLIVQVLWIVVPILGVLMNTGVLLRLRKMAKEDWERFETSCAFTLAAMSFSDIICLLALLCQVIFMQLGTTDLWSSFNDTVLVVFCKLSLYTMHMASAFSIWCWLVLSVSRFVAVYKPIVYRVMWRGPRRALVTLAVACAVLEVWILRLAVYDSTAMACYDEHFSAFHTFLHLFEIFWSYLVPLIFIIMFDFLVLCRNHSNAELMTEFAGKKNTPKSSRTTIMLAPSGMVDEEPMLHPYISKRHSSSAAVCANERTQKKLLHRCILLTLVNLTMNLPSYALRVYGILNLALLSPTTHYYLEMVSQSLYFGQFSCNAIYLAMVVYAQGQRDKWRLSRPSSRCETQTFTFQSCQL